MNEKPETNSNITTETNSGIGASIVSKLPPGLIALISLTTIAGVVFLFLFVIQQKGDIRYEDGKFEIVASKDLESKLQELQELLATSNNEKKEVEESSRTIEKERDSLRREADEARTQYSALLEEHNNAGKVKPLSHCGYGLKGRSK